MVDALQLVEHRIGQRQPFPADLQPPVRKVKDLHRLIHQPRRDLSRMQRELHAVVVHHQLPGDPPRLTPAQDVAEIVQPLQRPVQIPIPRRRANLLL